MKKEELLKKVEGLSEELADKIVAAYAGYVPKARFDEVNEAKKNAEALVKERDTQIETLKTANADNESLKQQIADLQESNKKAVEAKDAEIKKLRVENAVKSALTAAGAKNNKAVLPFLNLENAEFDDNGDIKGLSEQIDNLKKAEDSAFLFNISKEPKRQKMSGVTPKNSGDKGNKKSGTITKEDFAKMSYKQRVELFNSDKELYESLASNEDNNE